MSADIVCQEVVLPVVSIEASFMALSRRLRWVPAVPCFLGPKAWSSFRRSSERVWELRPRVWSVFSFCCLRYSLTIASFWLGESLAMTSSSRSSGGAVSLYQDKFRDDEGILSRKAWLTSVLASLRRCFASHSRATITGVNFISSGAWVTLGFFFVSLSRILSLSIVLTAKADLSHVHGKIDPHELLWFSHDNG